MRLAAIGDIHGNSAALRAVLDSAARANVDALLVTGDMVGYYFDPAGALDLLEPWQRFAVRGNHEDLLADARRDPQHLAAIDRKYGSGLRAALDALSPQKLDSLCTLPHPLELVLDGKRILLCHGSPWDNDCYVYPDADPALLARCAVAGYDYVILGHTHHPMLRQVGGVAVLNPGSVGQPRNRRPGAQWALIDTGLGEIELCCEQYDYEAVAAEARRRHPELAYLADVLVRM